MRARDGADAVKCIADICDPIAKGFVHRVFKGRCAATDGAHFRAEKPHTKDVGFLPHNVCGAHKDNTFQAKARRDCGGGNAVLPRACLGDNAALAHALGQQDLAHAIIDFMRARMVQLVALEIDLGRFAAILLSRIVRQALCVIKRGGTAHIMGEKFIKLGEECRVGFGFLIGFLKLKNRRHQRFGDIASAKITKAAVFIWCCYIVHFTHDFHPV